MVTVIAFVTPPNVIMMAATVKNEIRSMKPLPTRPGHMIPGFCLKNAPQVAHQIGWPINSVIILVIIRNVHLFGYKIF